MNFDYTYISLKGFFVFEPLVIVTNAIFCSFCVLYFTRLRSFTHPYARQMSWFILFLGISSMFGALAHAVHFQLGMQFFNAVFFLMNALSLFSIYYCFRAAYTYRSMNSRPKNAYVYIGFVWLLLLLIYSFVQANFLLIKIHAGITLTYSLVVHYLAFRANNEKGSRLIVAGIGVSFLSILVHSLKLSFHEWFNYKDISHVIMIISLLIIYRGIKLNTEAISEQQTLSA